MKGAAIAAEDRRGAHSNTKPLATPRSRKRNGARHYLRRARASHAHLNAQHRYAVFDLGWLHQGLSGTALRILLVLTSHAGQHRGTCFPSIETIARECKVTDSRRVRRGLRALETAGAVITELRKPTTSLYWIRPAPSCENVRWRRQGAAKTGSIRLPQRGVIDPTKRQLSERDSV